MLVRALWLTLAALFAWPLFGDGGALQLQQNAGPYLVSVFAAPCHCAPDRSILACWYRIALHALLCSTPTC